MASEAISEHQKISWGTCPQTPLVLHAYEVTQAYWHAHIHVTPLLKILATGLFSLPSATVSLYSFQDSRALCVFNIRFSLVPIIKLVSLLDYRCHRIELLVLSMAPIHTLLGASDSQSLTPRNHLEEMTSLKSLVSRSE